MMNLDTEHNPVQVCQPKERRSQVIEELVVLHGIGEVPVCTRWRKEVVWVMAAHSRRRDKHDMYTGSEDQMVRLKVSVCRVHSPQVWPRALGVPMVASNFAAQLSDIVAGDDPVEELNKLWQISAPQMQKMTTAILCYFMRSELSDSERTAEIRDAARLGGNIGHKGKEVSRPFWQAFQRAHFLVGISCCNCTHSQGPKGVLPEEGLLADCYSALQKGWAVMQR
jgi:hypothetical protein